jgi:DinB superfamily
MPSSTLRELLGELDRALAYTDELQVGLTPEQIAWRPTSESSAIGWHLGHQSAVAHYMLRNLIAAEPSVDADIEALMDSATPERHRGDLPSLERIRAYRSAVAERIHDRIGEIDQCAVGAPNQLRLIASTLLIAIVNHEYQHSKWIGELRADALGLDVPPLPSSPRLSIVDEYVVLNEPSAVLDP